MVSALKPLLQQKGGTWIGWLGRASTNAPEPFVHEDIRNVPIALKRQDVKDYYEGFSNATLWPLYHDCLRPPIYRRRWWHSYIEINRRFADAAARIAAPGSDVWIHDYQLQLVPQFLRERRPDLRIGFFLHIPFPPTEIFSRLPWRRQIVDGLMGADVIGFQRKRGAQNFVALAKRHAGARGRRGRLHVNGHALECAAFPISIDFKSFDARAREHETQKRAGTLARRLGSGRKVFLGIDRLDYTKGIDARLLAYAELLERGRVQTEDVVLVQTAVPSRENVPAYQEEREKIERLVGEINGRFGRIGRAAVHYVHRSLPFDELVALYLLADVMLVTPLRDGMNLVAKEFVASCVDDRGVLILSEFAGAADELDKALSVNPHDLDGVIQAMEHALSMPETEVTQRMRAMRKRVREHDVHAWARSFLACLARARESAPA